uniref:Cytochrome c oxidase subunit 2 n=1 Tax=Paratomella rubra TaxID=90914 RepID=Q64LH9_PARRR|nr:cytochrome oxidase subunit 2 [Paratomella rubra]
MLFPILILILCLILYIMVKSNTKVFFNLFFSSGRLIEYIWTIIPMFILLTVGIPSLYILFLSDEVVLYPILSVKILGHQWFWSYEYMFSKSFFFTKDNNIMLNKEIPMMKDNVPGLEIDSYMIFGNEDKVRLLSSTSSLVLPVGDMVRLMVSSSDVLHCFTVPSLGLKIDAIPGRVNQVVFSSLSEGVFFGQCSELCGAQHSFMPIEVAMVNKNNLLNLL